MDQKLKEALDEQVSRSPRNLIYVDTYGIDWGRMFFQVKNAVGDAMSSLTKDAEIYDNSLWKIQRDMNRVSKWIEMHKVDTKQHQKDR